MEELKGYVFDCFDSDGASRYTVVRDEIAEYAGRTFAQGGDVMQSIKKERVIDIPEPADLSDEDKKNPVKVRMLEKRLDAVSNERVSSRRT